MCAEKHGEASWAPPSVGRGEQLDALALDGADTPASRWFRAGLGGGAERSQISEQLGAVVGEGMGTERSPGRSDAS